MLARHLVRCALPVALVVLAELARAVPDTATVARGPDGVRLRVRSPCAHADGSRTLRLRAIWIEAISSTGREYRVELVAVCLGARRLPVDGFQLMDRRDQGGLLAAANDARREARWPSHRSPEVYLVVHLADAIEVQLADRVEVELRVDDRRHRFRVAPTMCINVLGTGGAAADRPWDF